MDRASLEPSQSSSGSDAAKHELEALRGLSERLARITAEPIVLGDADGHCTWINDVALRRLEMSREVAQTFTASELERLLALTLTVSPDGFEQQLATSAEFGQEVADIAPSIIYVYDLRERRNVWGNRSMVEILGYSRDQLANMAGNLLEALIFPDDWAGYLDHVERLASLSEREVARFEYRMRRADGEWRWLESQDRVLTRDAQGRPTRIIGSALDITDRKEAEEQSRRGAETFYKVVEENPFGIYVIDADFRLAHVSRGAQKVFANVNPLIGRDFGDVLRLIWPEPFASQAIAVFRQTLDTGEPYVATRTVERREDVDDTEAYDWRTERITLPDGRHGVVCYFYDLTERLEFEAALRESRERLQAALEGSGAGTFRWNIVTNELEWDEELDRLFGLPPGQTVRELDRFVDCVHPDDRAAVRAACARCAADGEDFALKFRVVWPDGSVHWIDDWGKTFLVDGKPAYMTGMCLDVTDREEADRAIRESESFYRQTLESIPGLTWTSTPDGVGDFASSQWAEYSGRPMEAIVGKGWLDILHPDDRARTDAAWQRAIAENSGYSVEYRLRNKDGEYEWFMVRGRAIRDAAGNVVRWFGTSINIHELKVAQDALAVVQRRYEAGLQAARSIVYEWDAATDRVSRDGDLFGLVGVRPEDAPEVGEWWQNRIHPDDRHRLAELTERLKYEDQAEHDVEYRVRHEDGRWIWVSDRSRAECDSAGRLIRLIGQSVDISEIKEVTEALRASETLYRTTTEIVPQILTIHEPDGTTRWCNAEWTRFFGVPPAEVPNPAELVHPEDQARFEDAWRSAVETAVPFQTQLRLRRHDGEYRWHRLHARPLFNASGELERWVGSNSDVHDHVALAEALRLSESQYRQIAASLPQIVWTARADGTTDYFNERGYEYTDMPRDNEPGWHWQEYMHPDDLAAAVKEWKRCVETGDDYSVEYRFRRAEDGAYRWFLALAKPIRNDEGEIVRWFGSLTDIQTQKDLEDELERRVSQRTSELEFSTRDLEGFTYSVAHDLRAPLRAINWTSQALIDDLGPQLASEHHEMLERQRFNSLKLAGLIDDLLKFARFSKMRLSPEPVNLTELAHSVVREADYALDHVRFEIDDGLVATGDASAIKLVLENLINNAVKYSPSGGTIRIGRDDAGFFVADEGIGFPMEFAERIFRPFERLHRDEDFPGSGIGLANAKRIVERHHGRIWAESSPGSGATFRFVL